MHVNLESYEFKADVFNGKIHGTQDTYPKDSYDFYVKLCGAVVNFKTRKFS